MSGLYQSDVADAGTKQGSALSYGCPRLLLCYLGPPLLAKALGARGRRYVEAHLWLDLAFLAVNVIVDRGWEQGLRRLPAEMGLWPPRQQRRGARAWTALVTATAATSLLATLWLAPWLERASERPSGRLLNWTPLPVGWSPPDGLSRRRVFYLIPLAVFAEETYIRGLLWSRMGWLGRRRPLVNGTAWAFYHVNQPTKSVIGSILPHAIVASYARELTGNIYWTAIGHYLSNTYGAWSSVRQQRAGSGGI